MTHILLSFLRALIVQTLAANVIRTGYDLPFYSSWLQLAHRNSLGKSQFFIQLEETYEHSTKIACRFPKCRVNISGQKEWN
jgi:hypothetical protein